SRAPRNKSIVLSPMEPVAPNTVTLRTAPAAALLLRNGTALIVSPNHKTGSGATRAAAQNSQNRRERDRRDIAIQAVHQPAMAGNDVTGVLHAEAALDCGLEEIAELRGYREGCGWQQQWPDFAEPVRGEARSHDQAEDEAAGCAGPGLVRADPRPKLWAANGAAGEIAADIGAPDHQEDEDQRDEAFRSIKPHRDGRNLRQGSVSKAADRP